jgi:hypothetical protein
MEEGTGMSSPPLRARSVTLAYDSRVVATELTVEIPEAGFTVAVLVARGRHPYRPSALTSILIVTDDLRIGRNRWNSASA